MDCLYCLKNAQFKEEKNETATFCGLNCQNQYYSKLGKSIFDDPLQSGNLNRDTFGLILQARFKNDPFTLASVLNETDNLSVILNWIYQSSALAVPLEQPIGTIRKTLWKHALLNSFNNLLKGIVLQRYTPVTNPDELYNILIRAISNNNVEGVKHLLTYDALVPGSRNNWPLRLAIRENNTEIVKLLLRDPRVDKNVFLENSLELARNNKNEEIINLLR